MTSKSTISQNFENVCANIKQECLRYERDPQTVHLIAVSKRHPCDKITELAALGQTDFAENYLQEAIDKIDELKELPLTWHFIGHIQSRKCKQIAQYFDWVHTVSSSKIANKLNLHREQYDKKLNVLIQLNLQQENSKSGISADSLLPLANEMVKLPNLTLQGLMIIPKAETDFNKQLEVFQTCAELLKNLRSTLHQDSAIAKAHPLNQLSMGMSADISAAIAAGSSMLRVGTALFGVRD